MRESVVYQDILAAGERRLLLRQLAHKYGPLPDELMQQIEAITDKDVLERLGAMVLDTMDLESFRQQL